MDQVASRAGVSKWSLYLRWPNKVALVADALQHRARVVPEVPDTGSLPGDMRVFLTGLLRSRSEASRALAAVSGEIATNGAAGAPFLATSLVTPAGTRAIAVMGGSVSHTALAHRLNPAELAT